MFPKVRKLLCKNCNGHDQFADPRKHCRSMSLMVRTQRRRRGSRCRCIRLERYLRSTRLGFHSILRSQDRMEEDLSAIRAVEKMSILPDKEQSESTGHCQIVRHTFSGPKLQLHKRQSIHNLFRQVRKLYSNFPPVLGLSFWFHLFRWNSVLHFF